MKFFVQRREKKTVLFFIKKFKKKEDRLFRHFVISLVFFFFLVFGTTSVWGQELNQAKKNISEQAVYQVTHEVSNEILSPFCPGKTLAMCPSPAAADARRAIQAFAEQGLSKEQIKDRLIAQFGPEFRRITPGQDDNLVVFVLIGLGLLVCAGFIFYMTKKNRSMIKDDHAEKETLNELNENDLSSEFSDEDVDYLNALRNDYRS